MNEGIVEAFSSARAGFSSDRVLADPSLRAAFVEGCIERGIALGEEMLCKQLLNLRKAGKLSHFKSKPTRFKDDGYRYAAEIAVRHLERRLKITLDDILCSPIHVALFDGICSEISPGYSELEYRWAALRLRKSRSISPEILGHALPSTEVALIRCDTLDLDNVSSKAGLYVFIAQSETLYVGEANNLRLRLKKHLDHSDNRQLARYFWDVGQENLFVELHIVPDSCSTKARRALEVELIRSRQPTFNIIGKAPS